MERKERRRERSGVERKEEEKSDEWREKKRRRGRSGEKRKEEEGGVERK